MDAIERMTEIQIRYYSQTHSAYPRISFSSKEELKIEDPLHDVQIETDLNEINVKKSSRLELLYMLKLRNLLSARKWSLLGSLRILFEFN